MYSFEIWVAKTYDMGFLSWNIWCQATGLMIKKKKKISVSLEREGFPFHLSEAEEELVAGYQTEC
ncbi:hypothetical protein KP509_1Z066700 [Ceratopteris richardii]|nr:hypothetical protein KP509_1Z183500 [Ceratopteris richardii]KAH6558390.1 hypothetical protein KP509_1Z066700 [Ceratopteris richardii]